MTKQFDHQKIDIILHSRIRLAIMAALATVDEMDFLALLEEVNTTKGNLSVHMSKLENAKYIKIDKKFVSKKPVTSCKITKKGLQSFREYLDLVGEFAKNTK